MNGMPHQLFTASLQARDIYPELKNYFYKQKSNVIWEEFLTTKSGLWIDKRLSTDNTFHGSGRAVEKNGILLQIEKATETTAGDLTCHVFSLEDAVAHLSFTNPNGVLTTEKQQNQVDQNEKSHVWKFLDLLKIEKSLTGLDRCEMHTRNEFDWGVALPWALSRVLMIVKCTERMPSGIW